MKSLSNYLFKKYFECNKTQKQYWFDLYLKAYFKEQIQK
jgi:hypothetical protein